MNKKHKQQDEVLRTTKVTSTVDYARFKILPGNRVISKAHVSELVQLMLVNGNLTAQFPIRVTEDYYVIDGQHRLEALKQLGWEVAYEIQEGANIDTVRALNTGAKNWSWRDVATSYSELGFKEYTYFLNITDTFDIPFRVAMYILQGKGTMRANHPFYLGTMVVEDKLSKEKLIRQFVDLRDLYTGYMDSTNRDVAFAAISLMRSAFYDHDRMVKKMTQYAHTLPHKATVEDYRRALEKIFNADLPEEKRVRLF